MSMDTVEGNGVAAEAPGDTGVEAVEAPATESAAPAVDNWSSRTPESLIDEVKELRSREAARRQKYGPVVEVFDGLSTENAREILDLAGAVKNWDEGGIRSKITAWASGLGMSVAEAKAAAAEVIADATDDGDEPLTKRGLTESLQRWQAEQQREQAQQAKQQTDAENARQIRAQVSELGYDHAKDPVGHDALYAVAQRLMQESIGKLEATQALQQAHDTLEGWRTKIIDDHIAGKRLEARRQVTPSGVASTAVDDTTPQDLDEASRRARARIAAGQG